MLKIFKFLKVMLLLSALTVRFSLAGIGATKKLLIKEKVEMTLRDISMLYSAKIEKLQVLEKPKISVILTGDEISKKKSIVASNNTLIITSFAKIFGGDVIRPFALTMIIGVIIGTYSSVFIAVPTLLIFKFRPQDEDD